MSIKNFLIKVWTYIFKHKIISSILLIAIIGGGYYWYSSANTTTGSTRYILAEASKQTINTSVSGTGQVSASDQIALSFKASGQVTYLNAISGQKVSAGTLLAQIDTTSAEKSVRDAQASLDAEKITLQKLEGPTGSTTPKNKQDAIDTLNQSYQSGYNTISSVFIDLPTIMNDLQNILYASTFNSYQQNIDYYTFNAYTYDQKASQFKDSVTKSYQVALDSYNKTFNSYKTTTRFSDNATIDSTISDTYTTTKNIAQAVKDANNLIQFYKDTLTFYNIKTSSVADTNLTTLNNDSSKTNSDIISLLNAQNTISNDKDSVNNSDLDLQSEQLSLQQKQNSLQDAKDNLANYYIYSPFDGIIGAVSIQKGDNASSGSSAITFITQKQITAISLNEVDITKIKMGNKATLTFDAIDGLTMTGEVTEIDTIGTVSQGVVSYSVKIAFDTQDDRIKPGMSVNASIITQTKQNVLAVPNSAVKTKSGSSYVLVLSQKEDLTSSTATQGFISATAPTQKTVQIGISDDTNTEITSGLSEGDQVVSRTIAATSTTSATKTTTSTSTTRATNRATQTLIGGGGPPN
jgi:HlyD family secretion protein